MRISGWAQSARLTQLGLISAATLLSGTAMAQNAPTAYANIQAAASGPQTPAAIHSYWTAERMAAAIPKENPITERPTNVRTTAAFGATGAPGEVLGSPPTLKGVVDVFPQPPNAAAAATAPAPRGIAPAATVVPADGSYPGPHATYEYGPKYRTFPLSTVGKLFFTDPQAGNFVCSATATFGNAAVLNMIWTAGHCVGAQAGQRYYNNFLFCPSYDSGQGGPNPGVGCWSWSSAQLTGGWYFNGSWSRDYAFIKLQPTGTVISANVVSAVGGLGFAWNWGRDQHWHHYGYPSASPWTGGKLVGTTTEHRYDDSSDVDGPGTNAWGSGQTPGSSGSSVVRGFSYGGAAINSNVSFYYTSPTNEYGIMLHGPYYDTAACTFWKGGSGYTGAC